jgi:ArsR family transcriptional regulator
MNPERLFSLLSDTTRLRSLLLIRAAGEVCVCELTAALGESQPKISRHLALMREAGLVTARRQGTWMHYRMNPELPADVTELLESMLERLARGRRFAADRRRLEQTNGRAEASRCA